MSLHEHVSEYLRYCALRKELSPKTLKAYRIDLRQFFESVSCDTPDKADIERYIDELHKKYQQKTVKRKIASIKAFYNFLEQEELISESPFRRIRVKFKETIILPRIIPREEIEKLLNCMYDCLKQSKESDYKNVIRDVAVIELLFATGARVYEISHIRVDYIDLSSGKVRFMGKGGKERCVQIADTDTLRLLKKYYEINSHKIEESGYFFINRYGKRFTEESIREMLKHYTGKAGITRKITPHMFRHSFATFLIEEGVDISCVQHILGHSSIKTTQIYIHIATSKQAEILQNMHPRKRMRVSNVA